MTRDLPFRLTCCRSPAQPCPCVRGRVPAGNWGLGLELACQHLPCSLLAKASHAMFSGWGNRFYLLLPPLTRQTAQIQRWVENGDHQWSSSATMGESNERNNLEKRKNRFKVSKRLGLRLTLTVLSLLTMPSLQPSPQVLEGLVHVCQGKIWRGVLTWAITHLLSEECCWLPSGAGHTSQQAVLRPTRIKMAPRARRDHWASEDTHPILQRRRRVRRRILVPPCTMGHLPTSLISSSISSHMHRPPSVLNNLHFLKCEMEPAPHLSPTLLLCGTSLPTQTIPLHPPRFHVKVTPIGASLLGFQNFPQQEHSSLYCNCLFFFLPCDFISSLKAYQKKWKIN